MNCHTLIGPDRTVICGHDEGDHIEESELTGQSPCVLCGCQDFTEPVECPTPGCRSNAGHPGECNMPQTAKEKMITGYIYPHQTPDTSIEPERKTVVKWADEAMFSAEPIDREEGPQAHLLWMTPDPLAAIAGPAKMYKGETIRSLRDVTHAERHELVQEIMKTHLKMPFEAVSFHLVLTGVTRAFANQMVRQRTAAYAQRSDRFAVQEQGIPVGLPPSLRGSRELSDIQVDVDLGDYHRLSQLDKWRYHWEKTVSLTSVAYEDLVNSGMPQEDARGLFPLNTLTTIHYITNLRGLLEHGGNRLCTQAQFEWRLVFTRIVQAIRQYNPYLNLETQLINGLGDGDAAAAVRHCYESDRWQYETIADLFRPICYLTGKCEFKASFDRKCSIRNRVDANHEMGRPSEAWSNEYDGVQGSPLVCGVGPQSVVRDAEHRPVFIGAIKPAEWLLNPGAAR